MLKGISPLISPELLKVLAEMGHGDEIIFADAHFPAYSFNKKILRADGVRISDLLSSILPLIQVPKISNTNRSDLAVEFVNWNALSEADRANYEKVTAIIKDKVVKKEAINPGKRKPGDVLVKINSEIDFTINHFDHKCLYCCFKIRPASGNDIDDPFDTNINYCHYDEAHKDYLYQDAWAELIIKGINDGILTKQTWKSKFDNKESFNIIEFEEAE